ncbi:MAG: STAS domain-containing protein [Bacilli bacterium]|nr:STAS domain-containing protein [Bacilli bacterium]
MTIKDRKEGNKLIVSVDGRIDTTTAPELNDYFEENLKDVTDLELDLEKVDYISSAGLRTILFAQKVMEKQGKMVVSHVCKEVMETFELTCFTDFLTII